LPKWKNQVVNNFHYKRMSNMFRGFREAAEGFTLVELITAMAIIAILAAIAIPSYGAYINKARISVAISDMRMLEIKINAYRSDMGYLPATLNDIGSGALLDPWKHPYVYLNIEDGGVKGKGKLRRDRKINPLNTDYDLYSVGADGDSKTQLNAKESLDDIVRARDGAFLDLAEKF
jgi:general secretion pathway protein G